MGYKKTDECIKKAYDDERLFVLMTRDLSAPAVICEWIKQNILTQDPDKLREALECAIDMREKYSQINDRKMTHANARI